jgi:hypothetical protein
MQVSTQITLKKVLGEFLPLVTKKKKKKKSSSNSYKGFLYFSLRPIAKFG